MKTLSDAFKELYYARQSGDDVALILIEIDHADFAFPLRFVCNLESVTSNGDVYSPLYFEFKLPNDNDQVPISELVLDNVDRVIVATMRAIDQAPPKTPATVVYRLVRAADPDTVEIEATMTWRASEWDVPQVRGSITGPPILQKRYPAHQKTPSTAPGVFTVR